MKSKDLLKLSLSLNLSLITMIFTIVLAALLATTNPTQDQFKTYLKEEIKAQAEQEDWFTRNIINLFASPTAWLINLDVDRYDYLVFSTYHTTIDGRNMVWFGVYGEFYLMK